LSCEAEEPPDLRPVQTVLACALNGSPLDPIDVFTNETDAAERVVTVLRKRKIDEFMEFLRAHTPIVRKGCARVSRVAGLVGWEAGRCAASVALTTPVARRATGVVMFTKVAPSSHAEPQLRAQHDS
jgi:hypothetical protein